MRMFSAAFCELYINACFWLKAPEITVDYQKLESEPGTMYAGFPSALGFGVGGQ